FPVENLLGVKWTAGDKSGTVPNDFKDVHLFSAQATDLKLEWNDGRTLIFHFEKPTNVMLQDNRQWSPGFSIRMGPQGSKLEFKKGETVDVKFQLTAAQKITLGYDGPVTIVAGADWLPLKLDLDVEPGSALDFSKMGLLDAPAGKHGR